MTIYNVHLRCILPEVNQSEKKYCSSVRYFTQCISPKSWGQSSGEQNCLRQCSFMTNLFHEQFCICHGVGSGTSTVAPSDSSLKTFYSVIYFFMILLSFSIVEERIRSELGIYINLRPLHLKIFFVCIQDLEDILLQMHLL